MTNTTGRTPDPRTPRAALHARSRAATTDAERMATETDGGQEHSNGNVSTLATYTDDEYGYTIAYPADWSVEQDPGNGTTFEAPAPSSAGAVVFVEKHGLTAADAAAAFLDDLDADENVYALEPLAQRNTQLESGQTARVVECAYIGDSFEWWRLSYLFVRTDDTGYTVGVDWNDDEPLGDVATRVVESFAVDSGVGDGRTEREHQRS